MVTRIVSVKFSPRLTAAVKVAVALVALAITVRDPEMRVHAKE
jgi:hypothetical protein